MIWGCWAVWGMVSFPCRLESLRNNCGPRALWGKAMPCIALLDDPLGQPGLKGGKGFRLHAAWLPEWRR